MSEDKKQQEGAPEMSGEDAFGGIFERSADDFIGSDGFSDAEKNPDFYTPSLKNKNVKDGTYESLIRFVPNADDSTGKLQVVSKWIYYLPDPDNPNRGFYVDCPSNRTGGKNSKGASRGNILSTAFFYLKDHESKVMRSIARQHFSRKRYHWALVHVLQDNQEPEDVGTIKIMRYGKIINDMIAKEDKKGKNVFLPLSGKDFNLVIDEKDVDDNRTITSYEKSYFADETDGIIVPEKELAAISEDIGKDMVKAVTVDKNGKLTEPTEANKLAIFNFLKKNSPDLSQCVYKPWDEQMEQKVIDSVRDTIGDEKIFDVVFKKAYGSKKARKFIEKEQEETKEEKSGTEAIDQEFSGGDDSKKEKEESSEEEMHDLKEKVAGDDPKTESKSAATEEDSKSEEDTGESSKKGEEKSKEDEGDFTDHKKFNFDDLPGE